MLEILKDKFQEIYRYISGTGKIREENINEAVRKIKLALLEADVHYKVVKSFIENVKSKSLGEKVLKSITPAQQFIKIVYDELVNIIGKRQTYFPDIFPNNKVTVILLVGLNGSGKTTTAIKLGKRYNKSNPLIIASDLKRPAAIEQLIILGKKYSIPVYYDKKSNNSIAVIKEGISYAKEKGYNLVIVDTAGRNELDEELMNELREIVKNVKVDYKIFIADASSGQNLLNVALQFHNLLNIDGAILTKFDSDARGGAALSLKYITNIDILFIGTGENVGDLEEFNAHNIANRILGMTDIVELVKSTEELINKEEAIKLEKKLKKEEFDLEDFLAQLRAIYKSGYLSKIIQMLPINIPSSSAIDEKKFKHIEAIILSMTPQERRNVEIIDLNRKIRIAKGSGRPLSEVTQLIEQYKKMKKMLKNFLKSGINNRIDINSFINSKFAGGL